MGGYNCTFLPALCFEIQGPLEYKTVPEDTFYTPAPSPPTPTLRSEYCKDTEPLYHSELSNYTPATSPLLPEYMRVPEYKMCCVLRHPTPLCTLAAEVRQLRLPKVAIVG